MTIRSVFLEVWWILTHSRNVPGWKHPTIGLKCFLLHHMTRLQRHKLNYKICTKLFSFTFHFDSVFNIKNRTRHFSVFLFISQHFSALSAFLYISLNFSEFLCISLHLSEFLCISRHFSAFFYTSLHFSAFCILYFRTIWRSHFLNCLSSIEHIVSTER